MLYTTISSLYNTLPIIFSFVSQELRRCAIFSQRSPGAAAPSRVWRFPESLPRSGAAFSQRSPGAERGWYISLKFVLIAGTPFPSGVQGQQLLAGFGKIPGLPRSGAAFSQRGPGAAAPGRVRKIPKSFVPIRRRFFHAGSRGGSPWRGLGCPRKFSPSPRRRRRQAKKKTCTLG